MPSSSTIQFEVNINCNNNQEDRQEDDESENLPIINEVDFFAADTNKEESGDADAINDPDSSTKMVCLVNTGLNLLTTNMSSDQSMVDDGTSSNCEDKRSKNNELVMIQAELQRVSTENQRLKDMLNQVTGNYNDLQLHFMTLMQQQQQQERRKMEINKESNEGMALEERKTSTINSSNGGQIVRRQLLDLVLSSGKGRAETDDQTSLLISDQRSPERSITPVNNGEVASRKELQASQGIEQMREGTAPEDGWNSHKLARLSPPKATVDQTAAEATMRKARVSVRARSEAPMVQRCAEDRTILITTYEGSHNHPLPPAAMAMASTTSCAARMLLSGSMPSSDGILNPNFLARTLLPCSSSMATISASAPFPTVTLDLTQSPSSSNQQQQYPPRGASSSPSPQFAQLPAASALLPQILGQALYNQSKFSGLHVSQHHEGVDADAVNAAIAADPSFKAALAAAISSIIGANTGGPVGSGSNNNGSNSNTNGN